MQARRAVKCVKSEAAKTAVLSVGQQQRRSSAPGSLGNHLGNRFDLYTYCVCATFQMAALYVSRIWVLLDANFTRSESFIVTPV